MINISLTSPLFRIIFLAVLLPGLLLAGWFATRTALGDRLMAVTHQQNDLDTATKLTSTDGAVRFAPDVSLLHYQRGLLYLAQASGDETEFRLREAISSLRTATNLSPEDYRVWLALGQALNRHGETEAARQAFKQALTLAPQYFESHWAMGNFLLRNNETEQAFAELKQALAIRPTELPLLFDYAWNTYNGDVPTILRALPAPPEAKPLLANSLVAHEKVSEGMKVWQELSSSSPAIARQHAKDFIGTLSAKQHFGAAYEVWQTAAQMKNPGNYLTEDAATEAAQWYTVNAPDVGSLLSNGSFERDLLVRNSPPFLDWRLYSVAGLTISRANDQHQTGNFSLRLNFEVPGNQTFMVMEQAIPIKPSARYRLSFAAKTEDLLTLSSPFVEVFDPADIKRLHATAKPFPLKNNAWENYALDFMTAAATEIVIVRVMRPACGEPPCPLSGKIWLDDFKLAESR